MRLTVCFLCLLCTALSQKSGETLARNLQDDIPTFPPTPEPTLLPSTPTLPPFSFPTPEPIPTPEPTPTPEPILTPEPTISRPSRAPTASPTASPTNGSIIFPPTGNLFPTLTPTVRKTLAPSTAPVLTDTPTTHPSATPTAKPTKKPPVVIKLPNQPTSAPSTSIPTSTSPPVDVGEGSGVLPVPILTPTLPPTSFAPTTTGEIIQPPGLEVASFSGDKLTLLFGSATDEAKVYLQANKLTVPSCQEWFRDGPLLFGIGSTCFFRSPDTLVIVLGAGATVRLGDDSFLELKEGFIRDVRATSLKDPSSVGEVFVDVAQDVPFPVASLKAPQEVSEASDFVLDGTGSVFTGELNGVSWWFRRDAEGVEDSMIQGEEGLQLKLSSSDYGLGDYIFTLYLYDFRGFEARAVVKVSIVELARPTLVVVNGEQVIVESTTPVVDLEAALDFSSLSPSARTYWASFEWVVEWQLSEKFMSARRPSRNPFRLVLDTTVLRILSNSFQFVVTARPQMAQQGDSGKPVTLTASVQVEIKRAKPVALIRGGNRQVNADDSLVLDGSLSYDPGSSSGSLYNLWFAWLCRVVEGSATRPCGFTLPNRGVIEILPGTLDAGQMYQFTLFVGGDFGWERNSTSQPILVYASEKTVLSVSLSIAGFLPLGSVFTANRNEPVRFLGSVKPLSPGITCTFKEINDLLDLTDPSIVANTRSLSSSSSSAFSSRSLVIRPNALRDGVEYVVSLTCKDQAGRSGVAVSSPVRVNLAPRNGRLVADSTTSVIAGSDLSLSTYGWQDDTSGNLQYSFRLNVFDNESGASVTSSETSDSRRIIVNETLVEMSGPQFILQPSLRSSQVAIRVPMQCTWVDSKLLQAGESCDLLVSVVATDGFGASSEAGHILRVTKPEDGHIKGLVSSRHYNETIAADSILTPAQRLRSIYSLATLLHGNNEMLSKLLLATVRIASAVDPLQESVLQLLQVLQILLEELDSFVMDAASPRDLFQALDELFRAFYQTPTRQISVLELDYGKLFVSDELALSLVKIFTQVLRLAPSDLLEKVRYYVRVLSRGQASKFIPGEAARVDSSLFTMTTRRVQGNDFADADVNPAVFESSGSRDLGITFSAPISVQGDIDLLILNWNGQNPHGNITQASRRRRALQEQEEEEQQVDEDGNGTTNQTVKTSSHYFVSDVVEFSLIDPESGFKYEVEAVDEGTPVVQLRFQRLKNETSNSTTVESSEDVEWIRNKTHETRTVMVCGFFNETTEMWSTEGCWVESAEEDAVVCACSHTTDFAAWARTEDIFVDTLLGKGFTEGDIEDKWIVIVVVGSLVFVCLVLALLGVYWDRKDTYEYHRAMSLLLIRRSVLERLAVKSAFSKWTEMSKQKFRLLRVSEESTQDVAVEEAVTIPILKPFYFLSAAPASIYHENILPSLWYTLKLRSRLFGFFFQYDPVFNRLHRALILTAVVLGKLVMSALFFHFSLAEQRYISDQILIALLSSFVFSIFVMVLSAVFIRIPPVPGTLWRHNAELKRFAKVTDGTTVNDRKKLLEQIGINIHMLELLRRYQLAKGQVSLLLFKIRRRQHASMKRKSKAFSRWSGNYSSGASNSSSGETNPSSPNTVKPVKPSSTIDLLEDAQRVCARDSGCSPDLVVELCDACEKLFDIDQQKDRFVGDSFLCGWLPWSKRNRKLRRAEKILAMLSQARANCEDLESRPAENPEEEKLLKTSPSLTWLALTNMKNPEPAEVQPEIEEQTKTTGKAGKERTEAGVVVVEEAGGSQKVITNANECSALNPQHDSKLARFLSYFAERDILVSIKFWPHWSSYIAYSLIALWCAFCIYFLLSWGFLSGNEVVSAWLPNMLLSLFISLVLMNPLMEIGRHVVTRAYFHRATARQQSNKDLATVSFHFVNDTVAPRRELPSASLSKEERGEGDVSVTLT